MLLHWSIWGSGKRTGRVEGDVKYRGGHTSMWGFFLMFPDVICRVHGTILPTIWLETLIAVLLGVTAYLLTDSGLCRPDSSTGDSPCGAIYISVRHDAGHRIVGVLLAFLVVFRSQIAWSLFSEGRQHVGALVANTRSLGIQVLASCANLAVEEFGQHHDSDGAPEQRSGRHAIRAALMRRSAAHGTAPPPAAAPPAAALRFRSQSRVKSSEEVRLEGDELAVLCLECIRLLKAFFFTAVEHVRSEDNEVAWRASSEFADAFLTQAEREELHAEFGPPQSGRRSVVLQGQSGMVDKKAAAPVAERRGGAGRAAKAVAGLIASTPGPPLARGDVEAGVGVSASMSDATAWHVAGGDERFIDPTRAKPLVVLLWLRLNLERLCNEGALHPSTLLAVESNMDKMVDAYNGMDKIDKLYLPLPYAQLLKIFLLFFVFTLPFTIAAEVGLWNPMLQLMCALGFFGLENVGIVLERPFGTDSNDLPLLKMGNALCDDLDAMKRSVSRRNIARRVATYTSRIEGDEADTMMHAASSLLGWGHANEAWREQTPSHHHPDAGGGGSGAHAAPPHTAPAPSATIRAPRSVCLSTTSEDAPHGGAGTCAAPAASDAAVRAGAAHTAVRGHAPSAELSAVAEEERHARLSVLSDKI